MSPSKAGCLRQSLVACCLLAAVAGCQFHRTGHGFIIRGQPWSLEFNRGDAPAADCQDACDGCARGSAPAADQPAAKPELLPWRSRLKGYRLAARFFRHDESDAQDSPAGELESPSPGFSAPEPRRPDFVLE
jgi:hypothetical protein